MNGASAVTADQSFFPSRAGDGERILAVVFHAFAQRPEGLEGVRQVIGESMTGADIYSPRLPLGVTDCLDPEVLSTGLLGDIDAIVRTAQREGREYRRIFLIGHSFGSILARKMFVLAHGAQADGTVELGKAAPWADRIARVILLAGMNRGWTNTSALSSLQRFQFYLGSGFGNLLHLLRGRAPVIFALRRGAPFLTLLRLQWLAVERALGDRPKAITIQLLGTIDDLVSPEDNVDLETGGSFLYLEVPGSGHLDVIYMGRDLVDRRLARRIARDPEASDSRARIFRQALTLDEAELGRIAVEPGEIPVEGNDVMITGAAGSDVRHVVFVIHGIRDAGFWTRRVARKIRQALPGKSVAVTSSYGYFGLLPFVWPWTRRAKVEWLLDQYVSARARYPDAAFSYVGHSNGTYLLASALDACHAVKFSHIVFAGSVVRRNYPWRDVIARGQAQRVLNFVATADWVVAIFPKGLQTIGLQDLGSAGHDGFDPELAESLHNVEWVKGGHGAAVAEDNWSAIVSFIADPASWPVGAVRRPSRTVRLVGWLSPFIWLICAALIIVPFYFLLRTFDIAEIGVVALLFVYAYVVKLGMTKF